MDINYKITDKTPITDVPGFSPLFREYIKSNIFFKDRFPNNESIISGAAGDFLKGRANSYDSRQGIVEVFKKSMHSVQMTDKQKESIGKLLNRETLTVTTGQQAGFLGGPLYTALKAFSVINIAIKFEKLYKGLSFVPVFWVEDNDHDNLEASKGTILTKDLDVLNLYCSNGISKEDRRPVSILTFDDGINESLEKLMQSLPETRFKPQLMDILHKFYVKGGNWSDAFIDIMNLLTGDDGMLFVKSSEIRASGIFDHLSLKELEIEGNTNRIIDSANKKLIDAGYHIQAKSSKINLFMHTDNERLKIKPDESGKSFYHVKDKEYSIDDLRSIAQSQKGSFSPNVLLRPVFQDSALPNAAYIGGPSEIGYCSQIRELYDYFSVGMPAFLSRHSATLVNPKVNRNLEKLNLKPAYFWQDINLIIEGLTQKMTEDSIGNIFDVAKNKNEDLFREIEEASRKLDLTLVDAVKAGAHNSTEIIEHLLKKFKSAEKRLNSELIEKYQVISQFLYPAKTLQERILSVVYFINEAGIENFRLMMKEIAKEDSSFHYFVKY